MSVVRCGIEGGPEVIGNDCYSAVPIGEPNESMGVIRLEKAHHESYICHQRMCGNYTLETNHPDDKASSRR